MSWPEAYYSLRYSLRRLPQASLAYNLAAPFQPQAVDFWRFPQVIQALFPPLASFSFTLRSFQIAKASQLALGITKSHQNTNVPTSEGLRYSA